ncbi:MAG: calcium/proton exchanger [Thermoproteota archaeon]|nr:calcium/proton exchanger [Thermoproteota archaeon]
MLKSVKLTKSSAIYILLIFAPIAAALEFAHADHLVLFVISAIALIPLAKLIGDSTEHLATYYGPTAGSLLNVTFGNAAEIIIAVTAISAGLLDLVKASITGAIIGNILLILGLSVIAGGFRYKEQSFSRENIGTQSSMLFLAIIGLAVPTILASTILSPSENQGQVQLLSDALAIILLIVYILGIVFTFVTHKHLFTPPETAEDIQQSHGTHWSKKKSFLFLAASMAGVIVVSEILVASVETTGEELGFGQLFVGAIIVGIVGNAAEHSSAILLARKGKMELSIGIAAGSGTQIALFVVPILVFAGIAMGQPFTLVFTLLELATIFLAAIILNLIVHDGRSNWFEGVMLTAVYIIIAIAFFFVAD